MADIHQPLPIRTLNPGDAAVKVVDSAGTNELSVDASGRVTVKLDDGSGNALTSTTVSAKQALDVNIAAGSITTGVADETTFTYGTSSYTPVGGAYQDTSPVLTAGQGGVVRLTAYRGMHANLRDASGNALLGQALSAASIPVVLASDQSTINTSDSADGPATTPGTPASKSVQIGAQYQSPLPTLSAGQQAALQCDSSGRLLVGSIASALPAGTNTIGKVAQDNTTQWVTSDLADGPVAPGTAATKSILTGAQYSSATGLASPLTAAQQAAIQVDANGRLLVGSIASALPAGTNALGSVSLNQGGSAVSTTNPLPVVVAQTIPGTQINSYHTTASLAVNAVANHVYTITSGKTFTGKKFWASASGKIRVDVQTSPDGSTYTTYWTGFNTEANLNVSIDLDLLSIQDSGTGSTIRINITNEDSSGSVFDVFSTISGVEN